MADDYKAPASPAAYVYWHILQKGWQAGSLIGVAGVVPVLALWKKVRDPATLLRAINYSALSGTAATATLGALKFTQIDDEGFRDRAYRLHYNEGQNRVDTFSAAGSLVGLAATAVLLPRSVPYYAMSLAGGAAVGTAAAVVLHVATRPEDQRAPNRAMHELTRKD